MQLPNRTTKKKLTAEEQRTSALDLCQRGWHSFRDTVTKGEYLCTTCGKKAYCPRCILVQPGTPLTLCATHRTRDEGRT